MPPAAESPEVATADSSSRRPDDDQSLADDNNIRSAKRAPTTPNQTAPLETGLNREEMTSLIASSRSETEQEAAKLSETDLKQRILRSSAEAKDARQHSDSLHQDAIEADLQRWRMENQLGGAEIEAIRRGHGSYSRFDRPVHEIVTTELPAVFGVRLTVGISLLNPFRILGKAAFTSPSDLADIENRISHNDSQLLTHLKSRPIGLGFDNWNPVWHRRNQNQTAKKILAYTTKSHRSNYRRFVHELFWLHVPEQIFEELETMGDLTSMGALSLLKNYVAHSSGREQTLARHALAIALHNLALTRELAFSCGRFNSASGYWDAAYECWASVLHDAQFLTYFSERAEKLRLRTRFSATTLRHQVGLALAAINAQFAMSYGQAGEDIAAWRHLSVLHRSGLPCDLSNSAILAGVKVGFY